MPTMTTERGVMERKIINVSKKRQITIPLQFYEHLGLGSQVECSLENGAVVIRPLYKEPSDFSVEILKDLVSQGYSGDELVQRFAVESKNIKTAVAHMLEEANAIAAGDKPAANFNDVFDSED